jgi:hypothetical protein
VGRCGAQHAARHGVLAWRSARAQARAVARRGRTFSRIRFTAAPDIVAGVRGFAPGASRVWLGGARAALV